MFAKLYTLAHDIEGYDQETGRGGCDGSTCEAILYGKQSRKFDRNMNKYINSTEICRREFLLQKSDGY